MEGSALDDAWAKLDRAQTHFDALDAEIRSHLSRDPYPITKEPHPNERGYILRVHVREEIPHPDWSLIAGDCVHNARSALDHLAWRMAGGDSADTSTQFPIFNDRYRFDRQSQRMVVRLNSRQRTFIRWHQSYRRRSKGRLDLLWMLQILNVSDKHKLLVPVAAIPVNAEVTFHVPGKTAARLRCELIPGPFVDGAEIGAVVVDRGPFDTNTGEVTDAEIGVDTKHLFDITLRDAAVEESAIPYRALSNAITYVRTILEAAERCRLV